MIYISKTAQAHFSKLLAHQEAGTKIRAFINKPGTAYAEVGISYCRPNEVKENDIILKFKKFTVCIDVLSATYLRDMEIDFIIDQLSSRLILRAPNAKLKKVAKDATLMERIEYFLQSQINPQLASHNGSISLVKITDDGYAILEFGGGCNGCSMVNITFKEGIEKNLLNEFPELAGVRDLTDHLRGKHSYC